MMVCFVEEYSNFTIFWFCVPKHTHVTSIYNFNGNQSVPFWFNVQWIQNFTSKFFEFRTKYFLIRKNHDFWRAFEQNNKATPTIRFVQHHTQTYWLFFLGKLSIVYVEIYHNKMHIALVVKWEFFMYSTHLFNGGSSGHTMKGKENNKKVSTSNTISLILWHFNGNTVFDSNSIILFQYISLLF